MICAALKHLRRILVPRPRKVFTDARAKGSMREDRARPCIWLHAARDNGASSFRWSITAAEGCSQSREKAVFDPRVLNGARGSGMPATLPLGSRHLCFQGIEATAVCEP
jgi:hypothetical protein